MQNNPNSSTNIPQHTALGSNLLLLRRARSRDRGRKSRHELPALPALTEARAADGRLALGLRLLLLGRLRGVRVGVVLVRVVGSVLQRGSVHGQHRGRPIAFGPGLLAPWRGTAVGTGGVQGRGTPYTWGALGRRLLLLWLRLLGRRRRLRLLLLLRWRLLLLVHVVVVGGGQVPQERRKACGAGRKETTTQAMRVRSAGLSLGCDRICRVRRVSVLGRPGSPRPSWETAGGNPSWEGLYSVVTAEL